MTLFDHLEVAQHGKKKVVRERRQPSRYQQAISDQLLSGLRRITVQAVPGSGKTTTLEMLCQLITDHGLVQRGEVAMLLAFNKVIVNTLKGRLPSTFDIRTLSSLGHLICTKNRQGLKFDPQKYEKLTREILSGVNHLTPAARRELSDRLDNCLQLHVGHDLGLNITEQDWVDFMDEVDAPILGAEGVLYRLTLKTLRHGLSLLERENVMGFYDQVLAPSHYGWRLPQPVKFLMIDELQDISAAGLYLLQAATDEHTVIIGVGDPDQAINEWAGADANAMANFTRHFGAQVMALPISYRCPKKVLDLARPLASLPLEAAPNAIDGVVEDISEDEFFNLVRPGALVICRVNAPLISLFYSLIARSIPAFVRGRDLSRTLVAFARDIATWDGQRVRRENLSDKLDLTDFITNLNEYTDLLVRNIMKEAQTRGQDPGLRIATLADKHQAMLLIYEQSGARTLGELVKAIQQLFQGDEERSVILTSAHRSKGTEADDVFVWEPDLMPYPKAKSARARHSEDRVRYVTYTRAKRSLRFVNPRVSHLPGDFHGSA